MNPETIPKNLPRRYTGPKGIPIEAILALKDQNLSKKEIAERLGINPSTVTIRLRPYIQELRNTENYVKYRNNLLQHWQAKIIQSITPADLEKANLRDKVISAGILFDKERLESGKSTQNIAYLDMIKAKASATTELQVIEAELVQTGVQIPVENGEVGYQEGSRDKSDDS